MTGERQVAVGYIGSGDDDVLSRRRATLLRRADDEGLTLADVLVDEHDVVTLSELADLVRAHGAVRLLLHADARLARYRGAVSHVVGATGATCTVVAEEP